MLPQRCAEARTASALTRYAKLPRASREEAKVAIAQADAEKVAGFRYVPDDLPDQEPEAHALFARIERGERRVRTGTGSRTRVMTAIDRSRRLLVWPAGGDQILANGVASELSPPCSHVLRSSIIAPPRRR